MERERALAYLRQYHYLGCNRPVGTHLLYLVRDAQGRDLAVHLVGAAAWQCAPRDRYIGWSAAERAAGLHRIGNHSRFLILPWVRVPHLASHLLGGLARRICAQIGRRSMAGGWSCWKPLWKRAVLRAWLTGRPIGSRWDKPPDGRARKSSIEPQAPRKSVWVYPLRRGLSGTSGRAGQPRRCASESAPGQLPLVLEIFALLFSNQWIGRWQKKWHAQKRLTRSARAAQGASQAQDSKQKKKKKKPAQGRFYERIFSLRVTLWYLIFQRLNFDQTLAAVVTNLREGGADRLGRRRRKLSRRVRSTQTSAYNQARQRLPLELLQAALAHLRQGLLNLVGLAPAPRERPGPAERTRQLLDGSTLALLVTPTAGGGLSAREQSKRNQRLVADADRGGILRAQWRGLERPGRGDAAERTGDGLDADRSGRAAFTIWIGDRNFGVWSVAAQAVRHRQDVLVRLTRARAAKLGPGPALAKRRGSAHPVAAQPQRSGAARHGALGGERALDLRAVAKEWQMDRSMAVHHPGGQGLSGRTAGELVWATLASRTALSFGENADENGRVGCLHAGDGAQGILRRTAGL